MKASGAVLLVAALLSLCRAQPTEKKGSCPELPSYPTCDTFPTKPKDECTTDGQCLGDEKCCDYGCSRKCKKPLQGKFGSCPYFNRTFCLTARPAPAECSLDNQCQGTERCCCAGACRMQCAETEDYSYCPLQPNTQYQCGDLPPSSCIDDTDCNNNERCCLFDGAVQCVTALENVEAPENQ